MAYLSRDIAAAAGQTDAANLQHELADLRAMMQRQQQEIAQLKRANIVRVQTEP